MMEQDTDDKEVSSVLSLYLCLYAVFGCKAQAMYSQTATQEQGDMKAPLLIALIVKLYAAAVQGGHEVFLFQLVREDSLLCTVELDSAGLTIVTLV